MIGCFSEKIVLIIILKNSDVLVVTKNDCIFEDNGDASWCFSIINEVNLRHIRSETRFSLVTLV